MKPRVLKNALNQIEIQKAIFKQVDFSISLGSASKELRELPDSAQEAQKLIYQRLVKGGVIDV